ncbi:DUF402 domain-containing protein [Brachybacterium huguangmaarense]|uniref:DUF402 domain-containing protein n=1 Tax=Brachybacterium huguangmaarense TaxID=1652028 RepID=A0ABY6G110_9MICO|nr:DUF402 domain-containing protein [Brachybacterium huguangmaarense]UYG16770.1 DUF402 domain-containing protein [Brachybacterium huguangmaarense]
MPSTRRWSPGDHVTWTYYTLQHPTRTVRPGTVVLDDDRGIVVWIAPGTEVLLPVLESGAALRRAGDEGMFTAPRVQSKQLWTGNGILMIGLPDKPYSVWLFYKDDGSLGCYYVNLETPFERTDEGVRTRDLVLDLVVLPRRDWHYKDEDELEGAERVGYFSAEEAEDIRRAGRCAVRDIESWAYPFEAGFEHFFPDPSWKIPELPSHYTWDLDLTSR